MIFGKIPEITSFDQDARSTPGIRPLMSAIASSSTRDRKFPSFKIDFRVLRHFSMLPHCFKRTLKTFKCFRLSSRLSEFGSPFSFLCVSHYFLIFSRVSDGKTEPQSAPLRQIGCRRSSFGGWQSSYVLPFSRVSDGRAHSVRPAGGSLLRPAQPTKRLIWAPRSDRPDRRVNDY